jgi:hypothetical protein
VKLARIGTISSTLLIALFVVFTFSPVGFVPVGEFFTAGQPSESNQGENLPDPVVHTVTSSEIQKSASTEPVVSLGQEELGRRRIPSLLDFASQVANGDVLSVRGVYSPDLFALQVEPQPEGFNIYVTREFGEVTYYQESAKHGVTGLLAHNTFSGKQFFVLEPGSDIFLIYGDGRIQQYTVQKISQYKKVDPLDLISDYIDIDTGEKYTSSDIFDRFYTGTERLTLQTCLERFGDVNWGLIFIEAYSASQNTF